MHTSAPSGSPACTTVMTWLTSTGCASEAAAARMLSPITTPSTARCSVRYGSSCRKVARGPSSGLPANGLRRAGAVVLMGSSLPWRAGALVLRRESAPAVLLVHGLPAHPERGGDHLPPHPEVAGPAHEGSLV